MRFLPSTAPRRVRATTEPRVVRSREGRVLSVPDDWILFPARRARALAAVGPCWLVERANRAGGRDCVGALAPAGSSERARRGLDAPLGLRAHEIRGYLDFAPRHTRLARALAERVAHDEPRHLTPARAVADWLRAHVTEPAVDRRRATHRRRDVVRALLADRTSALLDALRVGLPRDPSTCPLYHALADRD